MKILILGHGYVGSHLHAALAATHEVIVVKRNQTDYTDRATFLAFLQTNCPDVIINCSGYTGSPNVDGCEANKQDCWFYNVVAPLNVLDVARDMNVPVVHISSGCIYSGYNKDYTEIDEPNFGIYNSESSFYSKSKHAFETVSQNYPVYILRIRMPFDGTTHHKNYLYKLYKYDQLISLENSVTCLSDLCDFVHKLIANLHQIQPGIFNVVNPGRIAAENVLQIFRQHGINNNNWEIIQLENLQTVAKRSNCILDSTKINELGLGLPEAQQSLQKHVLQLAKNIQ